LGLATTLALVAVTAASAQTLTVGDPVEEYLRILQLTGRAAPGSFTVRPFSLDVARVGPGGAHPWEARLEGAPALAAGSLGFVAHDPELRVFANSRFPSGQNDGAVWQGRGLTTALDAGGTVRWRALTVEVRPTLIYSQNSSFELAPVTVAGMPEYFYPWRRIDLPQRFGPEALWTVDPGQSEARVEAGGISLGAGTKNLWWGPGIRNAIIMSNNAPGFPHAFLGTNRPLGIGVGELEARWIWGRLEQSDWFDPSETSTDRFITGIVATYSPDFLDGLSFGLTRVFYVLVNEDGTPASDYFAVFQGVRKKTLASPQNPTGDDEHDQLLSLFGRWVHSESGFELYWEWARNDHAWDLRDLILEPEHSQAYTLGLQKAFGSTGRRVLVLRAELTHLEAGPTFQVRSKGTYYAHYIVTKGYTHKGQVIGAGVGPGGNSQHIGADLYAPWGRAGFYLQRDVHDNDAYYDWAAANNRDFCCHDVSLRMGAHGLWFVDDFDLGGGLVATREYKRYFFGLDLWNLNVSLSARWRPRR
jgi:hypothetical protein